MAQSARLAFKFPPPGSLFFVAQMSGAGQNRKSNCQEGTSCPQWNVINWCSI